VTGPALPARIVAKVQVNPVRIKMVRRFDDVIAGKNFGGSASGSCLFFGGRIFGVGVVHGQTLEKNNFLLLLIVQ
jgi:hypothetical protein